MELRSAKPPDPFLIELATPDDGTIHLAIVSGEPDLPDLDLPERVLALLRQATGPMTRTAMRQRLRVQNQRLGDVLTQLSKKGAIHQNLSKGWLIGPHQGPGI